MAIPVICVSCGGRFNAPDQAAGRTTKCPRCPAVIAIPSRSAARLPASSPGSSKAPSEQSKPNETVPQAAETTSHRNNPASVTSTMSTSSMSPRRRILIRSCAIVVFLAGLGVGGVLIGRSIVRSRQHGAAEKAVKTVLEKWQAGAPATKLQDGPNRISFFDPHLPLAGDAKPPRLLKYEITGIKTNDVSERPN